MDCFYPITLPQRGRVPCGKCIPCLKRRQSDWVFRLTHEYKSSISGYFITLTYDEDHVPTRLIDGAVRNVLCKRDIQLWLKRLRRHIEPYRVRYLLCGEYGPTTLRPHYHVILFNFPVHLDVVKVVNDSWNKGFTVTKLINPNHFGYVAKYVNSYSELPKYLRGKLERPFMLCSRRPAIGLNYLTPEVSDYFRKSLSITARIGGSIFSLPRYYRNKLFDDDMKAVISERSESYRFKKFIEGLKYDRGFYATPYLFAQQSDYIRRYKDKLFKSRKL